MKYNWIYQKIFEDSFEWEDSLETTFENLFDHITLHDSYWKSINITDEKETILVIELDAFWNEKFSAPATNENWPFLVIKLSKVFSVVYNNRESSNVIGSSSSTQVDHHGLTALVGIDEKNIKFPLANTVFEDIYGGTIEMIHESPIKVLLFEKNGNLIKPVLQRFEPKVPKPVQTGIKYLLKRIFTRS